MKQHRTRQVSAPSGNAWYREIAWFAYVGFLRDGAGLVVVQEGDIVQRPDGSTQATLAYVPMADAVTVVGAALPEPVASYDACRECLFGMVNKDGNWTIVALTARQLGSTPEAILGDRLGRDLGIPFLPGSLLRMTEAIGENSEIEPGYCVFLYPDGTEMVMERVVDDGDGGFVFTDQRFRVHVDYLSVSVDTEIRF